VTATVTWNLGGWPLSARGGLGALNEDSDDKLGGHGYKQRIAHDNHLASLRSSCSWYCPLFL